MYFKRVCLSVFKGVYAVMGWSEICDCALSGHAVKSVSNGHSKNLLDNPPIKKFQ